MSRKIIFRCAASLAVFAVLMLLVSSSLPAQDWRWARDYASAGTEFGNAVEIHEDSLWVFAAGDFDQTIASLPGPPTSTTPGRTDGLIVKLDTAGNYLNHTTLTSTQDLTLLDLSLDAQGNVYVTGSFSQNADFKGNGPGPLSLTAAGADRQVFVAKLNSDLEGIWVRQAGDNGPDEDGISVTVVGDSVYVTGVYRGSATFGLLPPLANNGAEDIFLALYEANTGIEQWVVGAGGANSDYPTEVVADRSGVYVVGSYQSNSITFFGSVNQVINNSSGSYDIFAARFDPSNGAAVWAFSAGGFPDDFCNGAALDGTRLYICGNIFGFADFGAAGTALSLGGPNMYIAAFEKATGTGKWVIENGDIAPSLDALDLTTDGRGQVYCTGWYSGTVTFGVSAMLNSGGPSAVYVCNYDTAGNFSWVLDVSSASPSAGVGIAMGAGAIYNTGFFEAGPATFPSSPNILLGNSAQQNMYVGKINCEATVNPLTTVSTSVNPICAGAGTDVIISNTELSYFYQVRDLVADTLLAPPQQGNNGNLSFSVGPLSATMDVYVLLTDSGICSRYLDTITITVWPLPQPSLGPDTAFCNPISETLDAGAWNAYSWSTGAMTQTIAINATGQYEVTVTDINGCQGADTIIVSAVPPPVVNLGPDTTICPGTSIQIGAQTGQSYLWSTGATTDSIIVSAAGQYYLDLTDGNGCVGTDTLILTIENITTPNLGPDTAFCDGPTLTLDAGNAGAGFAWSTGAMTQTIAVGATGQYDVTVTVGQCQRADTIDVTVHPLPVVNIGPDATICTGDSLQIGAQTGQTYLWSTGATTDSIFVNTAGQYFVDLTDGNGCVGSDTMTLSTVTTPMPALGNDTAFCLGGAIVLDAGPGGSYLWSTGATVQGIVVGATGQYAVTVTTGSCIGSDTINVTVWMPPLVNVGPDTTICTGDSLQIGALTGQTYNWSTGATTDSIFINTAGAYAVTVTDGNGCTGSDTMTLSLATTPMPTLGNDTAFCLGGAAVLDAGPGGSYLWSTGATVQGIVVGATGQYAVTVTTGSCTGSDTINVTVWAPPVTNLGPDTAICTGDSLQIGVLVGQSYNWSTGATTDSIFVNTSGAYAVTVTDGNGCSSADTMNLTTVTLMTPVLGADTSFCAGDSLLLDAGNTGANYTWSTGATTQTIYASSSGQYWVEVSAGNCNVSDTIEVTVWAAPVFSLGPDTAVCVGDSAVFSTAVAGSYLWSTGSTAGTVTVASPGDYWLAVTDSNGCTGRDTVRLDTLSLPVVSLLDTAICAGDSVALDAGFAGGSYSWNTGATAQVLTVTDSGWYAVTVTVNGCSGADSTFVGYALPPQPDLGPDTSVCAGTPLLLVPGVFTSYEWSTGATNGGIFVSSTGTYAVTVTDANGCAGSDTILVTTGAAGQVSMIGLAPEYCESDSGSSLLLIPQGGVLSGPVVGTSFDPAVAGPGTHVLAYTVTDSLGCSATATDSTLVLAAPSPADAGPDQFLSNVSSTMLAATPPVNGTGAWRFYLGNAALSSLNDPSAMVNTLMPGTYGLEWTVSNGFCPATVDSVLIVVESPPELVIPSGFSPNNDGRNEAWVIRGIEVYGTRSVAVFNRWGNEVYSADAYASDWTGVNQEGGTLADDTYYYVLDLGDAGTRTGYVVIKR